MLTAGLNDIEISPQSGKDGQSLVVKKQYYYDIADFEHGISDAAESFWQQGVSRYCGELSVGGQTLKTNNGFCLRPLVGEDPAEAKVTFDLTKTVLTEGNMSMYREDFNNAQTLAIWQQINAADPSRSGMTENGEVQGHLALWDSILELDNIEMIDSCASGGHRLDLESMRRAVAIHPTDYNYNDLPAKQQGSYGMSAWFPFTGANTGWGEYHGYTDKYIMRTAYRQSIACQVHL